VQRRKTRRHSRRLLRSRRPLRNQLGSLAEARAGAGRAEQQAVECALAEVLGHAVQPRMEAAVCARVGVLAVAIRHSGAGLRHGAATSTSHEVEARCGRGRMAE